MVNDKPSPPAPKNNTAADFARIKDVLDAQISLAIESGDDRTVYELAQLKRRLPAFRPASP
jgi:hypothetical protein